MRVDPELLSECADWIAEQMAEDGFMIDGGLIEQVLRKEQAAPVGIPQLTHAAAAAHLAAELAADGVQGIPDAVDERLIVILLQWEDEFLALAGRPRC